MERQYKGISFCHGSLEEDVISLMLQSRRPDVMRSLRAGLTLSWNVKAAFFLFLWDLVDGFLVNKE
eukprot:12641831-Ditylum_brightwellii.AAC.1